MAVSLGCAAAERRRRRRSGAACAHGATPLRLHGAAPLRLLKGELAQTVKGGAAQTVWGEPVCLKALDSSPAPLAPHCSCSCVASPAAVSYAAACARASDDGGCDCERDGCGPDGCGCGAGCCCGCGASSVYARCCNQPRRHARLCRTSPLVLVKKGNYFRRHGLVCYISETRSRWVCVWNSFRLPMFVHAGLYFNIGSRLIADFVLVGIADYMSLWISIPLWVSAHVPSHRILTSAWISYVFRLFCMRMSLCVQHMFNQYRFGFQHAVNQYRFGFQCMFTQ